MDDYNILETIRNISLDAIEGYGYENLPCALDEQVYQIINNFRSKFSETHNDYSLMFENHTLSLLIAFAERMAILGVREKSSDRLLNGLIALVLTNFALDFREIVPVISLLYHSAIKISVDPKYLFENASSFATNKSAAQLKSFIEHPRHIHSMGYIEVEADGLFFYQRTWGIIAGGREAVFLLLTAMKNGDKDTRINAAQALNEMMDNIVNSGNLINLFKKKNDSRSKRILNQINESLETLRSEETTDRLIPALRDKDFSVRRIIAELLGKIGDKRALPALAQLEQTHSGKSGQSKSVKDAAVAAIARIQAGGKLPS